MLLFVPRRPESRHRAGTIPDVGVAVVSRRLHQALHDERDDCGGEAARATHLGLPVPLTSLQGGLVRHLLRLRHRQSGSLRGQSRQLRQVRAREKCEMGG